MTQVHHTRAGHQSAQSKWEPYPVSRHTVLGARCMLCTAEHIFLRLQTWDLNILSLLMLCSCGGLHLNQTSGKSLRSLRPRFRAFDSRAESVDAAHFLARAAYQQIPATGYRGLLSYRQSCSCFAPSSSSVKRHRLVKPSHFRYFNYLSFILIEMGCRAIVLVALPQCL